MKYPKIMIALLTKNDAKTLPRFLKAMKGLDYPKKKMRWVWIYGKSVDDTLDIILEFHKKNKYPYEIYEEPVFERKLDSALYNAYLCNLFKTLIKDEEYVLFADTDIVEIPPHTLKELIRVEERIRCLPSTFQGQKRTCGIRFSGHFLLDKKKSVLGSKLG